MNTLTMQPKVTAIIVNWNRKHDAMALLDSLAKIAYGNLSILVVDNASTDDSVLAIKSHTLDVILLENPDNLGGTGGFNTGVRYALTHLKQDYVWLLDNDALVDPDSVTALVDVMEQDSSIGIAGSKILNALDPNFVVETGARVDWRTASVIPVNRNVANKNNEFGIFDVEYVAICSALFRVSALQRIGVMDERYFLLWDDMDWGISFSQAGYRVVAVNHSVIYHPPFTEKRSLAVDNYYGIRNPLLTASKRARGLARCWAVLTLCRRAWRSYYLATFNCQYLSMKLSHQALADFLCNRWGKLTLPSAASQGLVATAENVVPWASLKGRVLLLNSGPVEEINRVIGLLASKCGDAVKIDVVIQRDRRDLLSVKKLTQVIEVNFEAKHALWRNFQIFRKLRINSYSLAINPSADRTSPFSCAALRLARFDHSTDQLISEPTQSVWKVCFAVALSELTAILFFPLFYLRALSYSRN